MPMSRPSDLAGWLAYLETLHPKAIEMGLARVREVAARLPARVGCPTITVSGTNGKGSTCAMIETVLRCAGYRVGLYASPHLLRYNERVRIAGVVASDCELVDAFNAVEDARTAGTTIPLTYFEFGTLAALWLFARANVDALVLEVGLGGRLDAVNIVDADVAIVTNVDLDHQDYLGPTREAIGREKAGIFRAGRPAICGDRDPPRSLVEYAREQNAPLYRLGADFDAVDEGSQWRYRGPAGERFGLPMPALRGRHQLGNAATALAALDLMRDRLPISGGAVREALVGVELPGRFQVLPGRPTIVLDVAHNPHAARVLAATLGDMGFHPETHAVFGMLADKDLRGVIDALRSRVDRWHVAPLPGPRGASAQQLVDHLRAAGVPDADIRRYDSIDAAFRGARNAIGEADRMIVFGSFLTVAAALAAHRPAPIGTKQTSHG
ncbi:MAG TPA: bifunctional tetrahydrofolate synthase/dihydrofolate synthase [Casimicrobiaceae bacterium]|nr:bifunctional tetrahydrofolate synthase/dihydrofolate synthase [Casimicrobiaceae bacterium]